MSGLRLTTAGESHGPAEVCILSGMPAGLPVTAGDVDRDLARRQRGYGRGGRMRIESDRVRFLAGIRHGRTLGTPIAMMVENRDHAAWIPEMQPEPAPGHTTTPVTVPRPGHADLAGAAKYGHTDLRNVLERSSARETVARTAAGALAKVLLKAVGIEVRGRVVQVGPEPASRPGDATDPGSVDWAAVEDSPFAADDPSKESALRAVVDAAREAGESVGGVFEVWAWGLPPGIGGFAVPEERLDGRLMGALGSIPAVKGVEVGLGFAAAGLPGSHVHDPIVPVRDLGDDGGWCIRRPSNRCGGLEGGMTTGLPLVLRAAMKPIPTLMTPLPSVDLSTGGPVAAHRERSDVEALAAATVVGEAVVALILASSVLEKFGGESLARLRAAYRAYGDELASRGLWCRS